MTYERQSVLALPWDGNDGSDCTPELGERPGVWPRELQVCRRRIDSHAGNERESGLLTVLKPTKQQQEVFLLINESLSKALCSNVLPIQSLQLQKKKKKKKSVFSQLLLQKPSHKQGVIRSNVQTKDTRAAKTILYTAKTHPNLECQTSLNLLNVFKQNCHTQNSKTV